MLDGNLPYIITESPLRSVCYPGYLENPKLLVKYMTEKIHSIKYLGNSSLDFREPKSSLNRTGLSLFVLLLRGKRQDHIQNLRTTPWVLGSFEGNVLVQCGGMTTGI